MYNVPLQNPRNIDFRCANLQKMCLQLWLCSPCDLTCNAIGCIWEYTTKIPFTVFYLGDSHNNNDIGNPQHRCYAPLVIFALSIWIVRCSQSPLFPGMRGPESDVPVVGKTGQLVQSQILYNFPVDNVGWDHWNECIEWKYKFSFLHSNAWCLWKMENQRYYNATAVFSALCCIKWSVQVHTALCVYMHL